MRLGLVREFQLNVEELSVEVSGDWDPLEKWVGSKELVQKEKMFLSPTIFSHKKAYCQRPAIISRGHKFTHS